VYLAGMAGNRLVIQSSRLLQVKVQHSDKIRKKNHIAIVFRQFEFLYSNFKI
jgi:hypothetical protein